MDDPDYWDWYLAILALADDPPPPDQALGYDTGYRDGEHNREADIRVAVQYACTHAELIERLRGITDDPELELGSEWQ